MMEDGWQKVVFASDCIYEDWDEDKECPQCPQCGSDYSECDCPGPMQDDEYYYKEINGVLYAKRKYNYYLKIMVNESLKHNSNQRVCDY